MATTISLCPIWVVRKRGPMSKLFALILMFKNVSNFVDLLLLTFQNSSIPTL